MWGLDCLLQLCSSRLQHECEHGAGGVRVRATDLTCPGYMNAHDQPMLDISSSCMCICGIDSCIPDHPSAEEASIRILQSKLDQDPDRQPQLEV